MTTALPPRPACPYDLTSWTTAQLQYAAVTKVRQLSGWIKEDQQQLAELTARAQLTQDYKLLDLSNQLAALSSKRKAKLIYWQATADGHKLKLPRSLRYYYRKASHNETGCTRKGSWINQENHTLGITWATA